MLELEIDEGATPRGTDAQVQDHANRKRDPDGGGGEDESELGFVGELVKPNDRD